MNCERYQDLLSDFLDGSLIPEDHNRVEAHLRDCGACAEARSDLDSIVVFCRENRGEYDAVPNERALWLRISNTIESGSSVSPGSVVKANAGWWSRLMNQSWQLSFPRLAASAAVLVILVALGTVVGVRRFQGGVPQGTPANSASVEERYRQQQQVIAYWNQRVELNKARWSPQMRETFDRNMSVIDAAVNDSMRQLNQNPHDGISEDILNAALNDKVELLKEFADL
ncbi:MAG TPA: zf-HC2 domain-containing protein, partial [Pyrinomonadaceae bacterium]|nr:zf-HC2 domain-containing protein [Pyrinomonadaceae bacterium]